MNEIIVEETGLPLKFPDWREEAYQRAREFRQLSSDERWRDMAMMMKVGFDMVRASPRRQWVEERWLKQEAEWQEIQRKLMVQYGQ